MSVALDYSIFLPIFSARIRSPKYLPIAERVKEHVRLELPDRWISARCTEGLESGERNLVLKEMRAFVESLQLMLDALSKDDMKGVAKAARAMGMVKSQDVSLAMVGKLPLEFKKLAFGVHGGFDTIANDAEAIGTTKHTLGQLSEVLQKCVACHRSYQLKIPTDKE
jgi:hypothetical protein